MKPKAKPASPVSQTVCGSRGQECSSIYSVKTALPDMVTIVKRLAVALCLSLASLSAFAADVEVSGGWIRLLPAGVPAAGYFELRNSGKAAVALVAASSPAFGQAMLHRTALKDGRSTMMRIDEVEIPAGGQLAFAPGGYHLMLIKPTRELRVGDDFALTLEFASGAKITAQLEVRGPS